MKVQGSYASVIKGVSQQAPADRLEGQHGEVLNMVADPVRGMVRRNGFILENQTITGFSAAPGDALTDSFSFRAFTYRDGGQDFDILYRSRERYGDDTDAHLPALIVRERTVGAGNGWVPVSRPGSDAPLDVFESSGISAITSIGSYVLFAANGLIPSYGTEAGIDNLGWKNSGVVWVRGGSYGRTYRVKARRASTGQMYDISYTTPLSTYGGVLNLSTIPPMAIGTPYEQYFVNILQANYDTAVNQHIAMASRAIQPDAIAQELVVRLIAAGFTNWGLRGSHMVCDDLDWIEVSDGGDGEFMRAVLSDVKAPDDLTDIARLGKVVRVLPNSNGDDAYYLKAEAKSPGNSDPYQTVIWREAAGVVQRPSVVVALGRLIGGRFFWASTPQRLHDLILSETGQNVAVPAYADSTAGDLDSVPPPAFFRKPITYLGTFQDRLVIASGSVINVSERGNYFNFYRTTMLTLPDGDPTEITAAGTETDTIRTGVVYDRDLMLVGDKFVYLINGQQAFNASTPNLSVQFSLEGAGYAQPAGVGKYVYLLKDDVQLAAARLLQVQQGQYRDSPELNDVSKQLRDYINGSAAEIVAMTNPPAVFVRTEHFLRSKGSFPRARPWGLYLYQYLDADNGQRVLDSWSAWEWSTALGTPIGITGSGTGDSLYIYTVAFGADESGNRARGILCLKASVRPDPTGLPYLDGLRPAGEAEAAGLWTAHAVQAVQDVVYTASGAAHSYDPVPAVTDADRFEGLQHPHYTVGDAPPEGVDAFRWAGTNGWLSNFVEEFPEAPTDNLWTGVAYPAFVDLTNPFVRDQDGKARTDGLLTLTSLQVTATRSAGMYGSWTDFDGVEQTFGFDDGYQRIRYDVPVWVGRDVKHVQVRLQAVKWYPLTINAITWKGNWYAYKGRA